MKSAYVTDHVSLVPSFRASGSTTRPASGNGSGARSTERTTLKIAVVDPMPNASVTTAAPVNAALRRSERTACAASCTMIDIRSSAESRGAREETVRTGGGAARACHHSMARSARRSADPRRHTRNGGSADRWASARRSR